MRADRLLSILMLLQTHGKLTTEQMARDVGVSRRTILRDLNALSSAGIPVYTESGPGGGVALDEQYQLALSGLSAANLPALFVSGMPSLLGDVGMEGRAEEILLQLFAALPAYHQQAVQQIRHRLHVDPLWWWYEDQPLPCWDALQQAVFEDRKIRAIYERHDSTLSERVLEPYSLVSKAGIWYLVARRDGEWRTYRVSRFQAATLLGERFSRNEAFDLAAYWRAHLEEAKSQMPRYDFTLRIPVEKVEFLRYNISGNSTITELPDDEGWFRAAIQVPSMASAQMLLFGLGAEAEVVEPEELHAAILESARRIVAAWESRR
ncbi:MAG: WYL domain-containing protein [Caldilineaceae bacterium]|nr:WYL domain-containing protein [Caldilineaceae bacterium]